MYAEKAESVVMIASDGLRKHSATGEASCDVSLILIPEQTSRSSEKIRGAKKIYTSVLLISSDGFKVLETGQASVLIGHFNGVETTRIR